MAEDIHKRAQLPWRIASNIWIGSLLCIQVGMALVWTIWLCIAQFAMMLLVRTHAHDAMYIPNMLI